MRLSEVHEDCPLVSHRYVLGQYFSGDPMMKLHPSCTHAAVKHSMSRSLKV